MIRERRTCGPRICPEKTKLPSCTPGPGLISSRFPCPSTPRKSAPCSWVISAPFSRRYSSARKIGAGRHHFAFRDGATRFVETNSRRNTLTIRGRDDWLLVCENPYTSPQFPDRRLYRKYTITSARDGKAVLRVKSLEQGTWTATELDLILPSDAQWIEIIPDQK